MREELKPLEDRLEALENDIKEIYHMIARLQKQVDRIEGTTFTDKSFQKLTLEQKLLKLNAELLAAAKQAGITLPR